jgi:aryl-alcohol dehydrogenase-like predicted oxidoreductase
MVREGHAASLTEMAMRFVISNEKLSTAEIGLANIEELEGALSAVAKGSLSPEALTRLKKLQATFLGEAR